MTHRRVQAPGELIYLSERKLLNSARARGIDTGWFETHVDVEGKGRVAVPLMPGTGVSAQAKVRAERFDGQQREGAVEEMLDQLVYSLYREGLPDLDASEEGIREGGWFRFHRRLRFGVGTDDSTRSVRALVLVDREPVDDSGVAAGLLMNGSPDHLRPPYRPEDLSDHPGARSGSGTGRLFRWLHAARQALEENPGADLDALEEPVFATDRPYRDSPAAIDMYRLFAGDDWMTHPRFPQLLDHAPCEWVAQASLVSTWESAAVVMASPLYVRVLGFPQSQDHEESRRDMPRRPKGISRVLGRRS